MVENHIQTDGEEIDGFPLTTQGISNNLRKLMIQYIEESAKVGSSEVKVIYWKTLILEMQITKDHLLLWQA